MPIEGILQYLLAFFLALGSQGIFAPTFSWMWLVLLFVVGIGVFPLATRLSSLPGALLISLYALLSLIPSGFILLETLPPYGWVIAVFGGALMMLEFFQGRPNSGKILFGLGLIILGTALFGATWNLLPFLFVMVISLYSMNSNVDFPREASKIMLLILLALPWGLKIYPILMDIAKKLFAIS